MLPRSLGRGWESRRRGNLQPFQAQYRGGVLPPGSGGGGSVGAMLVDPGGDSRSGGERPAVRG